MAILNLQRRLAEVGRIRLGQQVAMKGGKTRPAALTTFRLTSSDKARIDQAAQLYGGQPTQWESPNGLPQWEVITEADKLPVVVPPSAMAFSQYYELWSGAGCQRRCDGVKETLSEQPCICDPENRQCEIHTRLSVMLRDLNGLGVWRVDTQGFYAALELQGAVDVINLAAGKGQMLPATLRLDPRVVKREGEKTKKFVVPVLDIDISPAQLMMGTVAVSGPAAPALPDRKSLTPVPDGDQPAASIAEQVKSADEVRSRRRTAEVPSTGIAPRTVDQARDDTAKSRQAAQPFDDGRRSQPPPPEEPLSDDPWAAMDAAAEADMVSRNSRQDQPRMSTTGQLRQLGILLGEHGFNGTKEGKEARLAFCVAALQQIMPDNPDAGRPIESSKELTFDEASALIKMLKEDAAQAAAEPAVPMCPSGKHTVEVCQGVCEDPAENPQDAGAQIAELAQEAAAVLTEVVNAEFPDDGIPMCQSGEHSLELCEGACEDLPDEPATDQDARKAAVEQALAQHDGGPDEHAEQVRQILADTAAGEQAASESEPTQEHTETEDEEAQDESGSSPDPNQLGLL